MLSNGPECVPTGHTWHINIYKKLIVLFQFL